MYARDAIAFICIGCFFGLGLGMIWFDCSAKAQSPEMYWEMESLNARIQAEQRLAEQQRQEELEHQRRMRRNNPC